MARKKYYRICPDYNAQGHWQLWERSGLRWRWIAATPDFKGFVSIVRSNERLLKKVHHKIVWVAPRG